MRKKFFSFISVFVAATVFFSLPAYTEQEIPKDSKVLFMKGNVMFRTSEQSAWRAAVPGQLIAQGSEVSTDNEAMCVLGLGYKFRNAIKLNPATTIAIASIQPPKIDIKTGKIFTLVRDLKSGTEFKVSTPTAVAAARGTAWMQTGGIVMVFDDTVHVTSSKNQEQDVPQGKSVSIDADGNLNTTLQDNVDGEDTAQWKDFVVAIQQSLDSEDFVYVRNEKEKAALKLYTRKDVESYRKSSDKDWYDWLNDNEFVIRLNEEYTPTDEEDIQLEDGIVRSIHIVYADLFGPGSHNIAEVRINTRVPVTVDDNGELYGLRFILKNKYEGFDEGEDGEGALPPPLPEVSNEAQAQSTANSANQSSTLPKSINTWNQVNVSGFGSANNTNIPVMSQYKGFIYAGTTNTVDGAKLFRASDGTTYSNVDLTGVAGFAGTISIESAAVNPLPETTTSRLYIGTARDNASASPGNVFVTSNGTTFTDLTGGGKWAVDASDGSNDSPAITALIIYNGNLYAGVSFQRHNAEIWRRPVSDDAVAWTQVVTKANISTITGDTRDGIINDFSIFGGKIYAAIESTSTLGQGPVMISSDTGDSGDWELSGTRAFA